MLCLACALPGWPLCESCVASLRRAPPGFMSGVSIEAGFRHVGAAVRLVHNLKYRRSLPAGRLLAAAMLSGLRADATALVPAPRSLTRRVGYGIDQARFLANELSRLSGVPVIDALRAPLWWKRQAGRARQDRHPVNFTRVRAVPPGVVLIDDVVTTSMTARSAAETLGSRGMSVLVATSAGIMKSGAHLFPDRGGDVATRRRTIETRSPAAQPRPRGRFQQSASHQVDATVLSRPFPSVDREEFG